MTYRDRIFAIEPDLDPAHIEAFMRSEYSTLDHLSAEQFRREVIVAARCVRADPLLAVRLARSYGLVR